MSKFFKLSLKVIKYIGNYEKCAFIFLVYIRHFKVDFKVFFNKNDKMAFLYVILIAIYDKMS